VVRAQNGKPRATDGPYSETKEILGGSYTIEAPDYDQAVKLSLFEFGWFAVDRLYTALRPVLTRID